MAFTLYQHGSTGVLPYGGGTAYDGSGGAVRKLFNIGVEFENRSNSNDIFVPNNTADERRAVHNYLGQVPGVVTYRGNFIDNEGFLRRDKATTGSYCWGGSNIGSDPWSAPEECDAGFVDTGVSAYYTTGPMMNDIGGGYYNSYVPGVDSDPTANNDITGAAYTVIVDAYDDSSAFNYSGSVSGSLGTFRFSGSPSLGTTQDDGAVRIPLSSTFYFFGRPYDYCYFSTNGTITFHRPTTSYASTTNTINSPRQPCIQYRRSTAAARNNDLLALVSGVTYSSVTGGTRLLYTWRRYNDTNKYGTVEIYLVGSRIEMKYRDVTDSEFSFAVAPGLTGNLPAGLSSTYNSPTTFPYEAGIGTGQTDITITTRNLGKGNQSYNYAYGNHGTSSLYNRVYWAFTYSLGWYSICPSGFRWFRQYVRICKRGGEGLRSGTNSDDQWSGYTVP